jgi:hypothetical protein
LGVVIDSQLRFTEHLNYIIKSIAYKINYLRRISQHLSQWTRLTIYNTLIHPHFCYCATILYLLNQNEIGRLQKLQNRAMRIILNCSRLTSIAEMLKRLGWLPVRMLLIYYTLIFVFNIKVGNSPSYLSNKIKYSSEVHAYNTRSCQDFHVNRTLRTHTGNSVFVKGLILFNRLPDQIKNAPSLQVFKNRLGSFLENENI